MNIFNQEPVPSIELIKHLKEKYPDKLPISKVSLEELSYLQGQQNIIQQLEVLYNQNED
jgi:hypothetical protein